MNIIPKNLEECFVALESKVVSPAELETFISCPKEDLIKYHRNLGLWIRNNWNLWESGSKLKTFLTTQGFKHPDDMSQFIIEKFWEYLHHKNKPSQNSSNNMSEIVATNTFEIRGTFNAVKDVLDKLCPEFSGQFTTNCCLCHDEKKIIVQCGMDKEGNYKVLGIERSYV